MDDFMMNSSVYWIHHPDHTNMFTQGYIGVSNNIKARWNRHKGQTQNPYLKNAINKYGWDSLVKEILLVSTEKYCLRIESKLRSIKEIGWNIIEGGGMPPKNSKGKGYKQLVPTKSISQFKKGFTPWNKGIPMSTETKDKVSIAKLGTVRSIDSRKKQSEAIKGSNNHNYGKQVPQKTKDDLRLARLGKPSSRKGIVLSQETKDKISVANTGRIKTPVELEKLRQAHLGKKQTIVECPHCNKSGGAQTMPRWHFDNCKEKDNN